MLILVLCALSLVTSQHRARKVFQALEAEQDRSRALETEYDQLQIELSTWAVHPRIEKIASERMKMVLPPHAKVSGSRKVEGAEAVAPVPATDSPAGRRP